MVHIVCHAECKYLHCTNNWKTVSDKIVLSSFGLFPYVPVKKISVMSGRTTKAVMSQDIWKDFQTVTEG